MIAVHNDIKVFIILALLSVVSAPDNCAAADFAIMVKSGAAFLSDDDQRLDGEVRNFDDSSQRTLGLAWEIRNSRNVGLGMEYLTFEHEFTPLDSEGYTRTQLYLFSARQYFAMDSMVHPFVGIGLGWGYTKFHRIGDTDHDWNGALQLAAGLEFRFAREFGIFVEGKGLASGTDGERDNEFDFTGSGLLAGVSFIF